MVISQFERIEWKTVDELEKSDRGDGGFGSTGKI
jgi:dUTPase